MSTSIDEKMLKNEFENMYFNIIQCRTKKKEPAGQSGLLALKQLVLFSGAQSLSYEAAQVSSRYRFLYSAADLFQERS